MTNYYIKNIQYTPIKPVSCMSCGKNNLAEGIVISETGPNPSSLTSKKNTLCLYCETLMIVTPETKAAMSLKAVNNTDKITIVHNAGK